MTLLKSTTRCLQWMVLLSLCDLSLAGSKDKQQQSNNCPLPTPMYSLTATLMVDFVGKPNDVNEESLAKLGDRFESLYNDFTKENCDVMHRKIISVQAATLTIPEGSSKGELPFALLYTIKYKCYGPTCNQGGVLLSQAGGFLETTRRNLLLIDNQRSNLRRGLQSGCDCPRDATEDAPTIRQMVEIYRRSLKENHVKGVGRVQHMLEVKEIPCTGEMESFSLELPLTVEVTADDTSISTTDEEVLAASILTSFNYYSEIQCNEQFAHFSTVELAASTTSTITTTAENLFGQRKLDTVFISLSFTVFVVGYCRGCRSDWGEFVDFWYDRRRSLREIKSSIGTIRMGAPQRRTGAMLSSGTAQDLCYCAVTDPTAPPQDVTFGQCLDVAVETEKNDGGLSQNVGGVKRRRNNR